MPRIVILLDGKTPSTSVKFRIEDGDKVRVGIYAKASDASLMGEHITISEVTPGAPNPICKLDEKNPSSLFSGSMEIQATRPQLAGEGFGVYVERWP